MRAVVKAVQSSGKGVSYQARYIAESELNPEREGGRPRLLFPNRGAGNLTYRGANHFLTGGEGDPLKKDLIHLIVSFEEQDFEALGETDHERQAALREIAREAMAETKDDLAVRDWKWVAGIHLNTDNPHLHFLIHKLIESDDPERTRLGNFPKRLLPGEVKNQAGEKSPTEGVIGGNFVRALDRGISLEALRREELAPSPRLASLLNDLDAAHTERQVLNFESSLYEVSRHRPQANRQRQSSYKSLPAYERRYLSERIEEKTRSLALERGSDELALLEAARKGPSLAGREVTSQIIARGQETASGEPPDVLHDPRAAFEDPEQDDQFYETRYGKAGWLSKYSQWLRDDHERGAVIMGGRVLVLPAEEHELNPEIHDRPLFIHELRFALKEIEDPEKADEFHRLATVIAGKNASADGKARFFSTYFGLIKREGGDEMGRELASHETEARAEALEITLGRMRELAPLMERLETTRSIEVKRPEMLASLEQVRESKLAAIYDEPAFGEPEDGEKEIEGRPKDSAYVFNTAARKIYLRDDSLRFPAGIGQDTKELLVAHTLPWIDRQIESGVYRSEILKEINQFYQTWADSPRFTLTERIEKERDAYHRIEHYLKAYADERIEARDQGGSTAQERPFRITLDEPPPRLTAETRAWLAGEVLPALDQRIADGAARSEILASIRERFYLVEGDSLQPVPGAVESDPRTGIRIGDFLKAYASERTRAREPRAFRFSADNPPHGLTREVRARLVDETLPWIDQQIESGASRTEIYRGIRQQFHPEPAPGSMGLRFSTRQGFIADPAGAVAIVRHSRPPFVGSSGRSHTPPPPGWDRIAWRKGTSPNDPPAPVGSAPKKLLGSLPLQVELTAEDLIRRPVAVPGTPRETIAERSRIVRFSRDYLFERFKDPATRELNRSATFREGHRQMTEANSYREINQAAGYVFKKGRFDWNRRSWLFSGLASDRQTPGMRELRISFGLDREDVAAYAQEIKDGTREPSPLLRSMRRELYRRNTADAVRQFQASLRNREMDNPSEMDLYEMHKQLPIHERRYLYLESQELKQEYEGKFQAIEGVPEIHTSPEDYAQQGNESLRQYLEERRAKETTLIRAALASSPEEREAGEVQALKEEKQTRTARSLSPEELAAIRERARLQAWDRLVPEELVAKDPSEAALALRETIAEMQEKIQPQASIAVRILDEFSLRVTGHPYHEMPLRAFRKLSPDDAERLEEHRQYAERSLARLYDGFEQVDRLRQEIEQSRAVAAQPAPEIAANAPEAQTPAEVLHIAAQPVPEIAVNASRAQTPDQVLHIAAQPTPEIAANVAEAQTPAQARPSEKEPEVAAPMDSAMKETDERQQPQPAPRAAGEPPRESRSYREYTAAAVEIEQQLIKEAVLEKQNLAKDQPEIAPAEILLSREEKRLIRADATRRALTRLEPQKILTNDPAAIPLLKLQGEVIVLRDETQSQARESARELDAFIRTQELDRFIEKKTDYYYRGDQVPRSALEELAPDERQAFAALEQKADASFREFKAGFGTIDRLRSEIEQLQKRPAAQAGPKSRGEPDAPGGGRQPETRSSLNGFWRGSSSRHSGQAGAGTTVKAAEASTPPRAAREAGGQQAIPTPPIGESPGQGRSYREYVTAVAKTEQQLLGQLERQLLEEARHENPGIDRAGLEAVLDKRAITREEKLQVRSFALKAAWEEMEPRPMSNRDPAESRILSLREKIAALRDEVQPQLWKAEEKLDAFIRAKGLDQYLAEKPDYFYRAGQILRGKMPKLSLGEQREFAAREQHAGAWLHEFKSGFEVIDRIRGEIERIDDRVILGRAYIAHAHSDAAALDFQIAERFGHTFRFEIEDESVGRKRRISDLDVRLRAGAHGDRVADEDRLERYDDRLETRTQVSEADIHDHSTTLDAHARKLDRLTGELETEADHSLAAHLHTQELAAQVAEKYRTRGEPLPTPLVGREALVEAQEEAIEHRLAGHTEKLEWLRVALAEEHGQPMRPDSEMARLSAQLFTAETELRAQEAHARRFEETRHLRQWEITVDREGRIIPDGPDNQGETEVEKQGKTRVEKYSLAQVDREIKELTDSTKLDGKRPILLDYLQSEKVEAEFERLGRIRETVVEKIEERRGELKERVDEARQLQETLARAHDREATIRDQMGLEMPARQFTRDELERAAKNTETARDAEGLWELTREEQRFNEYADEKERFKPVEEWGRAQGRALMAEVFHRESAQRVEASEQRGERQPILIEKAGAVLHVESLRDTYPKTAAEWAMRPLLELVSEKARADRDARLIVREAYAQHAAQLQSDVELNRVYREKARGVAAELAAERAQTPGLELPESPLALTPDQAMKLEIYATRQADPEVRRELLSLARGSAVSHYDLYSQSQARTQESEHSLEQTPDVGRTR